MPPSRNIYSSSLYQIAKYLSQLCHTYIKPLSGAVAPSHCSHCYYRREVHSGVFRATESRPGATVHARATSLSSPHSVDRDQKKQKTFLGSDRSLKIPSYGFYFGDDTWRIRDCLCVCFRLKRLFGLSQIWEGSCILNRFICMLKANKEVKSSLSRYLRAPHRLSVGHSSDRTQETERCDLRGAEERFFCV